jgi:hypothetical protein
MDVTPDTVNFMILGYAVIFGCMAIYLVSLVVRFRNLHQDQQALDEVEKRDEPLMPKDGLHKILP